MVRSESSRGSELAEKLGVRPGLRVWLGGQDVATRRIVEQAVKGTIRPPTGSIDLAVICPVSLDEALYFAKKLQPRLVPSASCRVVTRKESPAGGLLADVMNNEGPHIGFRIGLVGAAGEILLFAIAEAPSSDENHSPP